MLASRKAQKELGRLLAFGESTRERNKFWLNGLVERDQNLKPGVAVGLSANSPATEATIRQSSSATSVPALTSHASSGSVTYFQKFL